jgi:hypothetical protein
MSGLPKSRTASIPIGGFKPTRPAEPGRPGLMLRVRVDSSEARW